jgi:hypothetical protein
VLVTIDAATRLPWFVTAVHTCGCYRALIPTENVPDTWLPNHWPQRQLHVYGQRLPARLPHFDPRSSRIAVSIAPQSHRFTSIAAIAAPADHAPDLRDVPAAGSQPAVPARPGAAALESRAALEGTRRELPLVSLGDLRALPIAQTGETVSFFYASGPLRGHVRGAWNPFEGLTLFGLVTLDPTVGMDKDFGDPDETGTPFYTFLRFWMHDASRLDRFDRLLRALDFELPDPPSEAALAPD